MGGESVEILSLDADGGLTIRADPGASRFLYRWGAVRKADGTWRLPPDRRARFERRLKTKPPAAPSGAPAIRRSLPRAEPPRRVETSAIREFIDALALPPDLRVTYRTPLLVCLRLTRPSLPALGRIRKIPGRRWNPNQGCWEIPTHSPADLEAIATSIKEITLILKADIGTVRARRAVEEIFAIEAAPALNEPVPINGGIAVFDRTSRVFRLHEGHGRQHPRLAEHVGKYACVLYGDWQSPPPSDHIAGAISGASSAST